MYRQRITLAFFQHFPLEHYAHEEHKDELDSLLTLNFQSPKKVEIMPF